MYSRLVILALAVTSVPAWPRLASGSPLSAEILLGTVANTGSRLRIDQGGEPRLEFPANWSSRPFEQPIYWALRVGYSAGRHAWALELHHHKLYLDNPPPEVENFTITHGTNHMTLQHAWLREGWRFSVLAGAVLAHPENTVRGRSLPEEGGWFGDGYHLAGPVVGGGIAARLPRKGPLGVLAEFRVTCSWLRVDVVDGDARLRNLAFHFLLGPSLSP